MRAWKKLMSALKNITKITCVYQLSHADYTSSEENLQKLVKFEEHYQSPIFTHCCGTKLEVKEIKIWKKHLEIPC